MKIKFIGLEENTLLFQPNLNLIAVKDVKPGIRLLANGKPCKVDKVEDLGLQPVYQIDFMDRTTHFICANTKLGRYRTYEVHPGYLHRIPMTKPMNIDLLDNVTYPDGIDYYIVGALIANVVKYSTSGFRIMVHPDKVRYISDLKKHAKHQDMYVYKINDKHKSHVKLTNSGKYINLFKQFGMNVDKLSKRFLPHLFLTLNITDRTALLKGILAGGSYERHPGIAQYETTAFKLMNDIMLLARTLGLPTFPYYRSDGYTRKISVHKKKHYMLITKKTLCADKHCYRIYADGVTLYNGVTL